MVSYSSVISALEKPDFKEVDLKKYQKTGDIIKDLIYCFKNYNYQCKPIIHKFSRGNVVSDSKLIYDFIKDNIHYEAEEDKLQTTKSFSRILHDKEGDCKHSALIVACLGWNLGYNVIFKFVSYVPGETFGHVYTILQDPLTKRKVIVDPLQKFNYEKPYYSDVKYIALNNQNDNKMLTRMTGIPKTTALSGTNDITETLAIDHIGGRTIVLDSDLREEHLGELEDLNGIGRKSKAERKASRHARQEKRHQKHAANKEKRKEKHAANKEKRKEKRAARGGSVFKKVSLAPVRAAFDALLLLNFRDLAHRLAIAMQKNEVAVQKLATKFGYKYSYFKDKVLKGSTKKALFGGKMSGTYQVQGVGSITITAAAITAAAPAVIATVALLKSLGIAPKEGANSDESLIKDAADAIEKSASGSSEAAQKIQDTIEKAQSILNNPASSPEQKAEAADDLKEAIQDKKSLAENAGDMQSNFMDWITNLPMPAKILGGAALLYGGYRLIKR